MGSVILLVVAAVWVAVLVPPLVRSRLDNRPNSSVSDFRDQLSSLQRAMPSSRSVRGIARPLAPSTVARPAASAARPPMRSGVRLAGGGDVRSPRQQAAMRPVRVDHGRAHDTGGRVRGHADSPTRSHARPAVRTTARDAQRQRRANVLFVLLLTAACTIFLAVTSKTAGLTYAAVAASVVAVAYVVGLAQVASARRPARAPRPARERRARSASAPVRGLEVDDGDEEAFDAGHRQFHQYRGERAVAGAPAARVEPPDDWYDPRRDRRAQPRSNRIARAERSSRRAAYDDWGYDPTPSGTVYGEPALFTASPNGERRHRGPRRPQPAAV